MRTPIIAGNWKMNKTASEAGPLIKEIAAAAEATTAEVLVCPPFTTLPAAIAAAAGTRIKVGAQDLFWKASGAYTGEVAPGMLTDLGVTHVLVGHSERRGRFGSAQDYTPEQMQVFGDTDAVVNLKVHAALSNGLVPVVCCGETQPEREAGWTDAVIESQLLRCLAGVTAAQAAGLVVAYEPVWAIGTGLVCGTEEASRIATHVRKVLATLFGAEAADQIRIQYGGSVKPDNVADLMAGPDVDGALVGGASLKAADFNAIIRGGAPARN